MHRTSHASRESLDLVVIIPALNEEATIVDVITRIPKDIPGVANIRALVIDDGSTDSTKERALAVGATVVSHGTRRGLGAALRTGFNEALAMGANLIVSIDADGQFDPATIPTLIAPVVASEADFATASRFIDPTLVPDMPYLKLWGNRMMSRLISRLIGQRFYDVSCGMRCYNRRAAISLNTIGVFTCLQEILLNLAFKHLRMIEVPIRVQGQRSFGKSRVANNLWRYGINTLLIIFRCYRDYKPMRFFGKLAVVLMVPAVALELFLMVHYFLAGSFSPHKWAGFTGAGLFALGLMSLFMGIIGDMLNRHRIYLEELLYYQRCNGQNPSDDSLPEEGQRHQ